MATEANKICERCWSTHTKTSERYMQSDGKVILMIGKYCRNCGHFEKEDIDVSAIKEDRK